MSKTLLFSVLLSNVTLAISKPILTIYTYHSFYSEWGPGPLIKKAFEKEYDCKIKFITLKNSVALLNRLRLEKENIQADIILGLDSNLLQTARNTGLFQPHTVSTKEIIIPGGWNDDLFLPYDYGYLAFIYDHTKVKNPPKSLHELIYSPKRSLKIIYEDPRSSTIGLGFLLWIQKIYGNTASVIWKQLTKNTLTITKDWSEAYSLFLKGEADMVLSYNTSPIYHVIKENQNKYKAAIFAEGHYQQIEVAGQLITSKQPILANRFMKFILTPAFQEAIPTGNWMYPVIHIKLPTSFSYTPQKSLRFTSQQVAASYFVWIKNWQLAVTTY